MSRRIGKPDSVILFPEDGDTLGNGLDAEAKSQAKCLVRIRIRIGIVQNLRRVP